MKKIKQCHYFYTSMKSLSHRSDSARIYGRRINLILAILFLEITRVEGSLATAEGLGTQQESLFRPRRQDLRQGGGLV